MVLQMIETYDNARDALLMAERKGIFSIDFGTSVSVS